MRLNKGISLSKLINLCSNNKWLRQDNLWWKMQVDSNKENKNTNKNSKSLMNNFKRKENGTAKT